MAAVMRKRWLPLAILSAAAAAFGCERVLGVDFESYREGKKDAGYTGPQLECVPGETSRCLCELVEGVRGCDDAGRLLPCVCGGNGKPLCGNGAVDDGEGCDDGDTTDGNGCSSACIPDGRPPAVEQCPGQHVAAWPGQRLQATLIGSLRAAPDGGAPDGGGGCGSAAQPDRVFALTPKVAGTLEVIVSTSVPTFVSLRTICASTASTLKCEKTQAGLVTSRTVDVTADQPVWLFLEPLEASPGATFSIDVGFL